MTGQKFGDWSLFQSNEREEKNQNVRKFYVRPKIDIGIFAQIFYSSHILNRENSAVDDDIVQRYHVNNTQIQK